MRSRIIPGLAIAGLLSTTSALAGFEVIENENSEQQSDPVKVVTEAQENARLKQELDRLSDELIQRRGGLNNQKRRTEELENQQQQQQAMPQPLPQPQPAPLAQPASQQPQPQPQPNPPAQPPSQQPPSLAQPQTQLQAPTLPQPHTQQQAQSREAPQPGQSDAERPDQNADTATSKSPPPNRMILPFAAASARFLPHPAMADDLVSAARSAHKISIIGYTDNKGNQASRLYISKRRALAVKRFLVKHDIDKDKISTEGRADGYVATNETAPGRLANRRVEVEFK